MAVAGIDMAAWDPSGKVLQDAPGARLLGGRSSRIPAYNSCRLGMIGPESGQRSPGTPCSRFPCHQGQARVQGAKTDLECSPGGQGLGR